MTLAKSYWAQRRKQKTNLGIFPIKPLALLVELHVPLVDVVNVIVWVVAAPPAINSMVADFVEDGSMRLLVACTC